jgi:HlyD family secretion protein
VSAETPGRVLERHFDEGTQVEAGKELVMLKTSKLEYQIEQSEATLSELAHQEASARSKLSAAEAQYQNLQRTLTRFRELLKTGATTQQSVDDLETKLQSAGDELEAARAGLQAIESRKAQVRAGSRVVQEQVADARVLSPLTGTVLVRYTDVGELLGIGSPVCDIASLDEVWVRIYIAETDLPDVRLGQKARVILDGVDAPLSGTVTWISSQSEFTPKAILTEETRTSLVYPAKVTVQNTEHLLKIGMPVTVELDRP